MHMNTNFIYVSMKRLRKFAHITAVVLNLVGGTEPYKFHPCIHRTLLIGKIKYDFFKAKVYVIIAHTMNHAPVAHKITVFKEQKQRNINFTHHESYELVNGSDLCPTLRRTRLSLRFDRTQVKNHCIRGMVFGWLVHVDY